MPDPAIPETARDGIARRGPDEDRELSALSETRLDQPLLVNLEGREPADDESPSVGVLHVRSSAGTGAVGMDVPPIR